MRTKELSLDELVSAVRDAVWALPGRETSTWYVYPYVYGVYRDYVIIGEGLALYRASYEVNSLEVVIAPREEWEQVEIDFIPALTVMKDANGKLRWLAISSSGFQDRDGEFVTVKALEEDCDRADEDGRYGPLRWWHMGSSDPLAWSTKEGEPWGVGVDLGWCDFNMVAGPLLIESGTFVTQSIGEKVAKKAQELELSLGFHHLPNEPDGEGMFNLIRRFERSLLPAGKASNLATGLIVEEGIKMATSNEERLKALEALVGESNAGLILSRGVEKATNLQAAGVSLKEASGALQQEGAVESGNDPEGTTTTTATDASPQETVKTLTLDEVRGVVKEALGPLLARSEKEAEKEAALENTLKERAEKEAALEARLKAQSDEIAALKAQVEELNGEVPAGVARGYRASQDEDTVIEKEHRLKEQQPVGFDPSFFDYVAGGNNQALPPQ